MTQQVFQFTGQSLLQMTWALSVWSSAAFFSESSKEWWSLGLDFMSWWLGPMRRLSMLFHQDLNMVIEIQLNNTIWLDERAKKDQTKTKRCEHLCFIHLSYKELTNVSHKYWVIWYFNFHYHRIHYICPFNSQEFQPNKLFVPTLTRKQGVLYLGIEWECG